MLQKAAGREAWQLAMIGVAAAIATNIYMEVGLPPLEASPFGENVSLIPGLFLGLALAASLGRRNERRGLPYMLMVLLYTALVTLSWAGPVTLAYALDEAGWPIIATGMASGALGGMGMAAATALSFPFFRAGKAALSVVLAGAVCGALLYFMNMWLLMAVWQGAVCAVIGWQLMRARAA